MATEFKGFERVDTLFIDTSNMPDSFEEPYCLYRERRGGEYRGDYNKYWSEFNPYGDKDYSHTFTKTAVEDYWCHQTETNNYRGTLEQFIVDYGLELDVWFINCGYDFTGVKEIILVY